MNRVQTVVEWGFGRVVNLWHWLDLRSQQKIGLEIGIAYNIAVILDHKLPDLCAWKKPSVHVFSSCTSKH